MSAVFEGTAGFLRVDQARRAMPELDELRPALDLLIASSRHDESTAWDASAELETVDARLVAGELLAEQADRLANAEAEHLRALYATVGHALRALAVGERGECARGLLEAARLEEERDRPSRARAYAATAYELARDEDDERPAALALRRRARAARALGAFDEALEAYGRSHDLARAVGDARGAAEAAVGAGNVLEEQGRWTEAESWYRHALDALPEHDRAAPERWHALLCLHICQRSRGAIEESRPLLEQAAQAAAHAADESAHVFLANARGQLAMSEGAFDAAEVHFRDALLHASGARLRVPFAVNLAESLLARGRVLDAAEHARSAEMEAIVSGLVTRLPEVYRMLGRIASLAGNAEAFLFFERALALVRERRLSGLEEAITLQAYAEAEERGGDRDTAQQLRERAIQRFTELGIHHTRRTWADVFGAGAEPDAEPPVP